MASPTRQVIVDLFAAHMPDGLDVLPYSRQIDPPTKATLMVRLDVTRPGPELGSRDNDVTLVVVAPGGLEVEATEAELDALLEDVLHVLERNDVVSNAVVWESATRAAYGEPDPTNPAFDIKTTIRTQKDPTP